MTRKTVIIIGNGSLPRELSATIDSADFVVRFNEPNISAGLSGSRTDLLMLATSSKTLQRRLTDPAFLQSPAFLSVKDIMLVYHPSIIRRYHPKPRLLSRLKGRRSDWTMQTIEVLGAAGKSLRIMPPQFYTEGCAELGIGEAAMRRLFPSTGFFGIRHILSNFPAEQWDIKLCGFSWEGWKRHAWDAEKNWVADRIASSRIAMIA